MRRRDFLLFRIDPARGEQPVRVVDLSCERLYMHYQRASATRRRGGEERSPEVDSLLMDVEPPRDVHERTVEQFLDDVTRELHDAEVIRLFEAEWLTIEPFRADVEKMLASLRDRGARIEYPSPSVQSGH